MKVANNWKDYEIIATANGEKLERWKDVYLLRPDPQIIWKSEKPLSNYPKLHAHYNRSNAGGGKGSEGWHSYSSKKLTNSILTKLDEILPYKTRGLKDGSKSLYEIKNTNSCATLIEVLFHDDYMQAKFITTNYYKIAKAIFDGIVSYLD